MLTAKASEVTLTLPVSDGRRIAWLYAHGEVLDDAEAEEEQAGPMRQIIVRLNPKELGQYNTL